MFAVYVFTLAPALTGGDSGELICAAAELGTAHPPGYPLWTLLAHGFTWLPFGSIAWRVALFSAICGAGAAGLLGRTVQLWTGRWWAGLLAGGLFAFAPVTWEYATQAEVFALNNVLIASVLWSATQLAISGKLRYACACALVSGFAAANHHTSIFVFAPVAAWVFLRLLTPAQDRVWRLVKVAGCALLGLTPYLYLPLAARFSNGLIWGEPQTWHGFLDHFLRRDYGTLQLASGTVASAVPLTTLLGHFTVATFWSLSLMGLPLALLASGALIRTLFSAKKSSPAANWPVHVAARPVVLVALGALLLYLFVFQSLVNLSPTDPLLAGVLARFWMLPTLLLAGFAGVGAALVLPKIIFRTEWIIVFCLGCVMLSVGWHRPQVVENGLAVSAYGRAILEPLPTNAVLLVRGDLPSNAIRYAQTIDRLRPDVVVLDLELLTRLWYVRQQAARHAAVQFPSVRYDPTAPDGFDFARLVAANEAEHSLWLYPETKPGDPSVSAFSFWPEGLPLRIGRGGEPLGGIAAWDARAAVALQKLDSTFSTLWKSTKAGSWERVVADDYWSARHRYAFTLLTTAIAHQNDAALLSRARIVYEDYLQSAPVQPWYAWKNLGMVYERLAVNDPTQQTNVLRAWNRYLEIAPTDDPDRKPIAEASSRLKGK